MTEYPPIPKTPGINPGVLKATGGPTPKPYSTPPPRPKKKVPPKPGPKQDHWWDHIVSSDEDRKGTDAWRKKHPEEAKKLAEQEKSNRAYSKPSDSDVTKKNTPSPQESAQAAVPPTSSSNNNGTVAAPPAGAGNPTNDAQKRIASGNLHSGGSTTAMDPSKPDVYFGTQYLGSTLSHVVKNYDDAENYIYAMSPAERSAWATKLYQQGLIKTPDDSVGATNAWFAAVQEAGRYFRAGKQITPWDVVDMGTLKGGSYAGSGSGGGSALANQTFSSTATKIQTIDQDTAHNIVRSIFQNAVGRDPTAGELSRFGSYISGYAKGHPETTATTTKYDANGREVSNTSSTSGGYTSQGLSDSLLQQEKADPEYAAYQAATTYYNAVLQAIASPV